MKRKSAMRCAVCCRGTFLRRFWVGAAAVAGVLLAGCASDSRRPEGAASGDPYSAPAEGEDPRATETNFVTIPCDEDADCAEGERCVKPSDHADGGPSFGNCED
jgi:hypothetical protein